MDRKLITVVLFKSIDSKILKKMVFSIDLCMFVIDEIYARTTRTIKEQKANRKAIRRREVYKSFSTTNGVYTN